MDSNDPEHQWLIPKITPLTALGLVAQVWWAFVLSEFQTHIGRSLLHPVWPVYVALHKPARLATGRAA